MNYNLKEILELAEKNNFAVPAFCVYNLETLMGVVWAAEETNAPVIIQMYSRLFDTDTARFMAPAVRDAMNRVKSPIAFHLDHGCGIAECIRAIRLGATGIMIDASTLPFDENMRITKEAVRLAHEAGIGAEGEIGHIGSTKDETQSEYTDVNDAVRFVNETGVDALAIMVGTAHGRYKKSPMLAIDRIKEIHSAADAHLVLHGGSGVPDDQIKAAISAGIRKVNFGTDVCYSFIDGYEKLDPLSEPLDVIMSKTAESVKAFALEKIKLLDAGR